MTRTILCAVGFVALALLIAGCNKDSTSSPTDKPNDTPALISTTVEHHGHKAGKNGGNIVEIGRDNYHAEVVFSRDGGVRIFTLGKDEAIVQEVESQILTAYVTPEGKSESVEFSLQAVSRPGDAEGKTSQFVGTLPESLRGRRVEIIVPSIRIEGTRYRIPPFSNAATSSAEEEMPVKIEDEEERRLYLTAAGKYTDEDIKANGRSTASIKFKGMKSEHDDDPKRGDKLCPISKSKASAKFTWIVDGKPYEFCCPPCVDEFVKRAKETPAAIKPPGDYVKK